MTERRESPGKFVLDATVVDEKENAIFSIGVGRDRIVVAPLEDCDPLTFLRFHRVVCENIDPEAEVSLAGRIEEDE